MMIEVVETVQLAVPLLAIGLAVGLVGSAIQLAAAFAKPPKGPAEIKSPGFTDPQRAGEDVRRRQASRRGRESTFLAIEGASEFLEAENAFELDTLGFN
jgi:hypothetical protein